MQISFGGYVSDFDAMYLSTQVASQLVYLGVFLVIIEMIISFGLGYTSKVYRAVKSEVVSVEDVHAQKSHQALLMALTYLNLKSLADKEAGASGDGDGDSSQIGRKLVHDAFVKVGMPDTECWALAQNVLPPHRVETLTYSQLSNTADSLARAITLREVATRTAVGDENG